jgi:hypothetical protein
MVITRVCTSSFESFYLVWIRQEYCVVTEYNPSSGTSFDWLEHSDVFLSNVSTRLSRQLASNITKNGGVAWLEELEPVEPQGNC